MSLQEWLDNSWIRKTERSAQVVANLLSIAERDVSDASINGISADARFFHAYSAVRCLCQLALHACGYSVPRGGREHERYIDSLRFTLGEDFAEDADYFDRCRRMRNEIQYDRAGVVQQSDADELLEATKKLLAKVREWLQANHADL